MYMRDSTDEDSMDKKPDMPPPHYDGHLFRTPSPEQISEPKEDAVPVSSHDHEKQTDRERGWKEKVTHWLDNSHLKGLLSSDILLSALAVWLLCNDNEDDDYLFIVLLFFLFK